VQEFLRSGISVLTSVNLLHVEEYKEKVQAITGKDTTEIIPESFLLAAKERQAVEKHLRFARSEQIETRIL
jgi:K+-sensing histidine kinase KdpD